MVLLLPSVEQPCDVSSEFEDLKAGTVIKNGIKVTNEILQDSMKKYWIDLDIYIKSICAQYANDPKPVTHAMREKIVKGLEIIVYVSQNGYMTPSKARKGFTRVGFHTTEKVEFPILGYENSTVDFDVIMSQCYRKIPIETVNFIRENAPELIRRFQINGKLVKGDYQDVGIWQLLVNENFSMVSRDDKVIWQQHAQLMTHDRTVAIWSAYLLGRDPVTLAANAAAAAAAKAAEKIVQSNVRAAQRLVDARERADDKKNSKEIERIRVTSLVGEEKLEYENLVILNKIAAREKKIANVAAKEAKNAAAIVLIAASGRNDII